MIDFYISKKDIKKAMPSASNYLIGKNFAKVKKYCNQNNIPLFDNMTLPTQAFCDYMKIDKELLLFKIKKGGE